MGFLKRGKRDGSGPFEGSFTRRGGRKGRRKEAGEICPEEDSEDEFF